MSVGVRYNIACSPPSYNISGLDGFVVYGEIGVKSMQRSFASFLRIR